MDLSNQDNLGMVGFENELDPLQTINQPEQLFDLTMSDADLIKNVSQELTLDVNHWDQAPWQFQVTDIENINYLLGDQVDFKLLLPHQTKYVDNRLFTGVRAILAYATGQTAKPEIMPSKTDDRYQRIAKNMEVFLYQHALDHQVNLYMRLALRNLISRKRSVVKLRFDEYYGPYGDICTENVDPANIVVDRFAKYRANPRRVYEKMRCSIEEMIAKFPDKEKEILDFYSIIRQTNSQMTRIVTYWECWFSYLEEGSKKEGLCWFIPDSEIILGKMANPNWIKKGSDKAERIANMSYCPLKPYIFMNYWNTGRSFFDETCLLDQAIPMQDVLNKRGRQIVENADYANPRTLIDKAAMDESDAKKFVNKNPKTIALIDTTNSGGNVNNAIATIPSAMLPSYVMEDKFDARAEIDEMLGTPTQFRGANAQGTKNPTLGQDLLVKNQASSLQDDLVAVAAEAWAEYYTALLQMMKVYLPDDYWVMTRGQDGQYAMITLNDTNIDTNVRLTIQTDSTLPLDKTSQRALAIQLAQIPGRIDDLSLFEMLGLPDAEKLADRVQRYNLDRLTYMQSIEQKMFDAEAEADITLVENNQTPAERDDYSEEYLNHWNLFITSNRFQQLPVAMQQKLVGFLQTAANKAATTQSLQDSMLNPAGIIDRPPLPPAPKVTQQIRLNGVIDPNTSSQLAAGGKPQLQQPPPGGAPNPGSPAPGSSQPSPPSVAPPPRT